MVEKTDLMIAARVLRICMAQEIRSSHRLVEQVMTEIVVVSIISAVIMGFLFFVLPAFDRHHVE